MTSIAAGSRPPRGALLTVTLSRNETAEWGVDPSFRDIVLRDMSKRAREKGKKFLEVYDVRGERLAVREVTS